MGRADGTRRRNPAFRVPEPVAGVVPSLREAQNAAMHDHDIFGGGDWRQRLSHIVETMRDVSHQTDPTEMVRIYRGRMAELARVDGFLSLSRRGLEPPAYLVARSSTWEREPDPWTERDALPVLEGGLLGELIHSNEPRLILDLEIPPDDPAAEYLTGMRSLAAIPVFDGGESLNLVVHLRRRANAFDPERFPMMVWITNLFSRATHNLVVSRELAATNEVLDAEHAAIGDIQRSLLPAAPPSLAELDVAVHYRASGRAGGDYYDFFPLEGGRWGVLIADVSGHGPPASVIMAVTHAIAHLRAPQVDAPHELLAFLNEQLEARYSNDSAMFVSALYGIFDPATRRFVHSIAGHPAPRVVRADGTTWRDPAPDVGLALGIDADARYTDRELVLGAGDRMLLYTDGAVEARDAEGTFFGTTRLDEVLARGGSARETCDTLVAAIDAHTRHDPRQDDLTLLVLVGR